MGASGSHCATRSLKLYDFLSFMALPSMASTSPDHRGLPHSGFWIGESVRRLIFAIPLRSMPVPDYLFGEDRKSTRLNSSHVRISYAVFCLKKKKKKT